MTENLPTRIDRAAIERIVQRATELQTGEHDIGEELSPEEVLALGKEVGIPDRYIRQAMLEEQSRTLLPAATGVVDRIFGAAVVSAQRVVTGNAEDVEQALLRWMDDQELLTVQRHQAGRITWEPVRGMQAGLRRMSAGLSGKQPFMLSKASTVSATVTSLEPGYCHVTLSAELGATRAGFMGGSATLAGFGLASTAVLGVMTPFWWIAALPLPIFLGISAMVSRQFRPQAARALLGLERALDHLERGAVKPAHLRQPGPSGMLGQVLDEVRKAIKP